MTKTSYLKIVALMISVAMMISFLPIPAIAEGGFDTSLLGEENENATFSYVIDAVQEGDEVTVTVTVKDVEQPLSFIAMRLHYDSEKVSPVVTKSSEMFAFLVEAPENWYSECVCSLKKASAYYALTYYSDVGSAPTCVEDGEVVIKVAFKVIGDDSDMAFYIDHHYAKGMDESRTTIKGRGTYVVLNATEIPPQYELGDVNGDGNVDSRDCSALLSYISGNGSVANPDGADFNSDGTVDSKDVAALTSFVAGN